MNGTKARNLIHAYHFNLKNVIVLFNCLDYFVPTTLFPFSQSMIGHGLGAAGGLEAIATIKAINTGWVHPTINQDVLLITLALVSFNVNIIPPSSITNFTMLMHM